MKKLRGEIEKIMAKYKGKERSKLVVHSGAAGKQVDTTLRYVFEDMVPCVIAGSDDITENFVEHFFDNGDLREPYHMPVSAVTFSYKFGKDTSGGNGISVQQFGEEPVNDEGDNMENNGWLFTPDGKQICFFPTNYNINADDDGIEHDFFDNLESNPNVRLCS